MSDFFIFLIFHQLFNTCFLYTYIKDSDSLVFLFGFKIHKNHANRDVAEHSQYFMLDLYLKRIEFLFVFPSKLTL